MYDRASTVQGLPTVAEPSDDLESVRSDSVPAEVRGVATFKESVSFYRSLERTLSERLQMEDDDLVSNHDANELATLLECSFDGEEDDDDLRFSAQMELGPDIGMSWRVTRGQLLTLLSGTYSESEVLEAVLATYFPDDHPLRGLQLVDTWKLSRAMDAEVQALRSGSSPQPNDDPAWLANARPAVIAAFSANPFEDLQEDTDEVIGAFHQKNARWFAFQAKKTTGLIELFNCLEETDTSWRREIEMAICRVFSRYCAEKVD